MSEFSESYHLRTTDKNEGKQLVEELGVSGIVFAETNGWVTVLLEGELNAHIRNVASNFDGVVLHYMYAADHAWMTNLFSKGNPISSFVCAWDPELHIEDEALDVDALSTLLLNAEDEEKLEALFSLADLDEIFEINPAYSFAALLGIEHYQWLAGHDIASHGSEIIDNAVGAELIG